MPEVAAPPAVPVELAPVIPAAPPVDVTSPPPVTTPAETPTGPAGAEQPVPPTAAATAVPPTAPVAPATPETPPEVPPEVQQHMAELQARDDQRAIQDAVTLLATQFETEQGFTPEQAKWAAQREVDRAVQHFRTNQAQQRRVNDAFEIGQKYGIDPRQLLGHPNPQAMIQAAMLATTFTKTQAENARLKAENEALKKGRVPPTTYAAPGVAATPAPGDYVQKLKSGGPLPTAAEIDAYVRSKYMAGSA